MIWLAVGGFAYLPRRLLQNARARRAPLRIRSSKTCSCHPPGPTPCGIITPSRAPGRLPQVRRNRSDSIQPVQPTRRNHKFDLLRIVFATFVLLAHAPELTDGDSRRELLYRLLHVDNFNFGALGVDGFFLLSGFLIVQSWLGDPDLLNYLRKRVLRIVPGYMVAALLSTFAAGLFAPGVDHFFRQLFTGHQFVASILMLGSLKTPYVYPDANFHSVNGSLWTIPYEFRCYLLVALWGLCGLFRKPMLWLAATVLLIIPFLFPVLTGPPEEWHKIYFLAGQPNQIARLTLTYFVGASFFLFRKHIVFRPAFAALATALILAVAVFTPIHIELAVILLGGYLLFYFGQMPSITLQWMKRVPDISYGVYLYGGPVEALWIYFHRGSPWITFIASVVFSYPLGWLSWHLVERPMSLSTPSHRPASSSLTPATDPPVFHFPTPLHNLCTTAAPCRPSP